MKEKGFFELPAHVRQEVHSSEHEGLELAFEDLEKARSLAQCSTESARLVLDYEMAVQLKALPLAYMHLGGREKLTIAVLDPDCIETVSTLRFAAGMEVHLVPVKLAVLHRAQFMAYHGEDSALEARMKRLQEIDEEREKLPSSVPSIRNPESAVCDFLATILDYAVAVGASDIHLIPSRNGTNIKIRVDGKLRVRDEAVCSLALHHELVRRVKVLAQLDITKRFSPHDGAFNFEMQSLLVRMRVGIMPTVHGEKVVLRLHGNCESRKLSEVGLPEVVLRHLEQFIRHPEGAILFAGSTGSGKTTTMYALIKEFIKKGLSVATIEDPVELELDGAAQTNLAPERGLDYPTCLRALLRQDPDILMVGEIRDRESGFIAFDAARTGHGMISTVHGSSCREVLERLKGFGFRVQDLVSSVSLIICQHLVPRLCGECKVFDLGGTRELNKEVYRPVGCAHCEYTGFRGRLLVVEMIRPSEIENFEGSWSAETSRALQEQIDALVLCGEVALEEHSGSRMERS